MGLARRLAWERRVNRGYRTSIMYFSEIPFKALSRSTCFRGLLPTGTGSDSHPVATRARNRTNWIMAKGQTVFAHLGAHSREGVHVNVSMQQQRGKAGRHSGCAALPDTWPPVATEVA